MYVIKRDGTKVPMRYDSITDRNLEVSTGLDIDVTYLSQLVINSLKTGMTTSDIDELSAETAFYLSCYNPDYDVLATRIALSNLHKQTKSSFVQVMRELYDQVNPDTGRAMGVLSPEFMTFVETHANALQDLIDFDRDRNYNYFGLQTMKRLYLLKRGNQIAERPQHMILRVAVAIHMDHHHPEASLAAIRETYDAMSNLYFTHASPTLFNAGNRTGNLSSCFLLHMADDLEHIFETNKRCALISKLGGGIGIDISTVRAKGSTIHSSNGRSDGLVPMIQCFNATARYSNQSGRRAGSFAMYLEPSHPDILDFLALRLPSPPDELRARDIFLALWIPNLFMERVEHEGVWSLFCPSKVPQLYNSYGDQYRRLYLEAEEKKLYNKQLPAQDVWKAILQSQQETGLPYMLYKDSVNEKSNQKNIGLIRSSNLCAEIVEYTDPQSVAVCNLASIALQRFVKPQGDGDRDVKFDFALLGSVVRIAVRNLNKVIDRTHYPVQEGKQNNLQYRPIGLGVQGLADVFAMMKVGWDDDQARQINRLIFECMYYYALDESAQLAQQYGAYSGFEGSPASQGQLQYHMWNETPWSSRENSQLQLDWEALRKKVQTQGLRNSLLIALMPTASSSQILQSNECFEPFTSNIYSRSTNSGEFLIVNKYLHQELKQRGLWDKSMVDKIIAANGSIQCIEEIPGELKHLFKTVWEIKQRTLIDLAADRAPFVDQTQSMNLFVERPTYAKLSSMHLYAWKKGLKTGSYYIRSRPARDAVKFTVSTSLPSPQVARKFVCVGAEGCESCSA